MKYCPLMSFQRATTGSPQTPCFEDKCGFADGDGKCLIKQALERYIIVEKNKMHQFEIESKQIELNKQWMNQYLKIGGKDSE